ncbi:uncharacterized protein LOC144348373 [Saccoglossus kowalevskii]
MNGERLRYSRDGIRKLSGIKSRSFPETDDIVINAVSSVSKFSNVDRPISFYGRQRPQSGKPSCDEASISKHINENGNQWNERPSSSYGRFRQSRAFTNTQSNNDNNIQKNYVKVDESTIVCDSEKEDNRLFKKRHRPKSSYGSRTPTPVPPDVGYSDRSVRNLKNSGREGRNRKDNKNSDRVRFRGRMFPNRTDTLKEEPVEVLSPGKDGGRISNAFSLDYENNKRSGSPSVIHSSPSDSECGSVDEIDIDVFIDQNADEFDPEEENLEMFMTVHSGARQRNVSCDTGISKFGCTKSLFEEQSVMDLYRPKLPAKKAYRLTPLNELGRQLRSASESDADVLLSVNYATCQGTIDPFLNRLVKDANAPLSPIITEKRTGFSNEAAADTEDETITDNVSCMKSNEHYVALKSPRMCEPVPHSIDNSYFNKSSPWLQSQPIETVVRLDHLSIQNSSAARVYTENIDLSLQQYSEEQAKSDTFDGNPQRKDRCSVRSYRQYCEKENDDDVFINPPTPPRDLPPPNRVSSKLHARRLLRGRSCDEILPSYPVIIANGKTIRASSKDSDSSEPTTPTSPLDYNMDDKLERSGSQKSRTPFASTPTPRPGSSASSRPGSALADRPRTGAGSRSGSGRDSARPARSIAQLKKLSMEEIDDLKDGKRSKLLRAQSLPEGGMGIGPKPSLAEMMDEIKECRYIRKQDREDK